MILSSHDMGVVEDTCRRVIILSRGRVVADDLVSNLVALFRTRAYRITLRDSLPEKAVAQLAQHFPVVRWLSEERALHVELYPEQSFYELVDGLRETGVQIEALGQSEPDLEEVFLRLVQKERGR